MDMNVCRVCLQHQSNLLPISSEINQQSFIAIFCKLLNLIISEDDGLPQNVCTECFQKIKEADEIQVLAKSSHEYLMNLQLELNIPKVDTTISSINLVKIEEGVYELTRTELVHFFESDIYKSAGIEELDEMPSEFSEILVKIQPNKHIKKKMSSKSPTDLSKLRGSVEKCYICNLEFPQKLKKIEHMKNVHESSCNSHECPICKYIFKTAFKLDSHIKGHFQAPDFICEECGKGFSKKENLKLHRNMHNNEKESYSCDLCAKVFKYKENLKRHFKLHETDRRFKCDQCMEGFTTQGCLNNHLYKNHNVVAPIRCTDCHRGFTYMSELKNHKNRFGKCPVPRDDTEKQKIKMNPISAKYQCSLCSREYKHLRALQFHQKFHSNSVPEYKCQVCFKTFHNSGNLQRHNMIHQNLKPFSCVYCKKAFNQKEKLIVHERIHTGIKPYECSLCLKKFSDPSCFFKHQKNIHNESKSKQ